MVHNIRITFGAQIQPQIEIQQGDYNSRTIQALCYASSGALMNFDGKTVSVVYDIAGNPSEEYPVAVSGNMLTFTMPGISASAAGSGKLQLRIYGQGSLLHSAVIPYTVKASIEPGQGEEDQVPMLVLLVQQAQEAIGECNKATENANKTVANIEKKLADGDFIGKTGDRGPQGFQGVGVTGASLNGQGKLVFTVKDPATGESSTLLPVDIDTSAAINTVEQAAQEGVQKVQDAQASAISAVDQAGKNAGTQAVIEVYSAKDTAIADIATVKSGAESAITAAQQSAVQTVQQSGTTAVGQVQKAQNTATTAIAQAQQNASTAVENEGDAQVQRLQEIIPQPTADNNGMVVAVQSGAYQLVNPAGLVLNDGVITSENGWSSKQIIDTLCPPLEVSGNPVQCYPVAGYPLSVRASWEPRQEGSGDPSPDNIRPITGLDSVQVTRRGKNLLDESKLRIQSNYETSYGGTGFWYYILNLPTGSYTVSIGATYNGGGYLWAGNALYGTSGVTSAWFAHQSQKLTTNFTFNDVNKLYVGVSANMELVTSVLDAVQFIQIEAGSTPTSYEPYTGTAATLALPETIYGGTVDAVTGEGMEEWEYMEFDGSEDEQWSKKVHSSGRVYFFIDITSYGLVLDPTQVVWKCNRLVPYAYNYSAIEFPEYSIGFTSLRHTCAIVLENASMLSVDEFKAWLAENPVTVCYKLATPTAFQATGSQPLPALPGTNTVYTDAGNITVTGASDPIATITALQNRVSALESAHTNM